MVLLLLQAVVAFPTCGVWYCGHPFVNLPSFNTRANFRDRTAELVPRYHSGSQYPIQNQTDIGTADTTVFDFDQHFPFVGFRGSDLFNREASFLLDNCSFNLVIPPCVLIYVPYQSKPV
jgi:hypothetical protein